MRINSNRSLMLVAVMLACGNNYYSGNNNPEPQTKTSFDELALQRAKLKRERKALLNTNKYERY